eukprot:5306375-Amphidinium_carterae.5
MEAVLQRATKELAAAATACTRGWREWLKASDAKGGKAIHQWLKTDGFSDSTIMAGDTVVIGDTAVQLLHQRWSMLWDSGQVPVWRCEVTQGLPDITADEVRMASQQMSYNKGQGVDGWTAAWIQWLPKDVIEWLAQLLTAYERLPGTQPQSMRTLVALIPKPNDRT